MCFFMVMSLLCDTGAGRAGGVNGADAGVRGETKLHVLTESATVFVDAGGPNDPGSGTYNDPFRRIQDALDSAYAGDTVEIRPGIYTGSGNYDLNPDGKSITIRSINPDDPVYVANTVIDPNGAGRGFYFDSEEDANCVVAGLTIRNGHTGDKGGGVFCYNASPTICNCIMVGNSAGLYGGALFCQLSDIIVSGCTITGNSAVLDGGGVECWSGRPVLLNCIISNNQAGNGYGGGVDCYNDGNVTLSNCTVVKNYASLGAGALFCLSCSDISIENSIIWANESGLGSQIALNPDSSNRVAISHCDLQGGQSAVHAPSGGLIWGGGNIDRDPCFASLDAEGDPNLWDLHLKSCFGRWNPSGLVWVSDSNTSACIDAANPDSDWSDEPWPNGKRVNMGAYGGTEQASRNGNPGDFNVSGLVDFEDFGEFCQKWHVDHTCIEDLTNNGFVDFADLLIFTENWLWQRQ